MLQTIRLYSTPNFPLVLIACRDCRGSEDCATCDNEGEVLVDEVFERDTVLDDAALEAHLAALEAHFAPIRAAQAARQPWPPKQPTPRDLSDIADMQTAYTRALAMLASPKVAA